MRRINDISPQIHFTQYVLYKYVFDFGNSHMFCLLPRTFFILILIWLASTHLSGLSLALFICRVFWAHST